MDKSHWVGIEIIVGGIVNSTQYHEHPGACKAEPSDKTMMSFEDAKIV
jgi:hypothetical protein